MSYQIVPNVVFLCSILGIVLLILRRLPEAASAEQHEEAEAAVVGQKLLAKGLPAQALSGVKVFIKTRVKKAWNFVLVAKDLKPHAAAGYRMKKIFGGRQPGQNVPTAQHLATKEVRNEKHYLDQIKLAPKNLSHYDALGKYYLEKENFSDARDIFQYLVNHEPSNPEYQARLGYCFYQTKQFNKAALAYQKSLALDSTQPNRYYNLGLSLEATGKFAEAAKSLEHAVTLEPATKYYISLSTAYLRLGNFRKAKEALKKAKKTDPQNQMVQAKLEKIV